MSRPLPLNDPARWMLEDSFTSTPVVFDPDCSICLDPEFAQMGLPLCKECKHCDNGHVAADDTRCSICGEDNEQAYSEEETEASS